MQASASRQDQSLASSILCINQFRLSGRHQTHRMSVSAAQWMPQMVVATCLGTTQSEATVSATLTSNGFTETVSAPIVCK